MKHLLLIMCLLLCGCFGGAKKPQIQPEDSNQSSEMWQTLTTVTAIPYIGILAMSGAVFIAMMGHNKIGLAVGASGGAAVGLSLAVIRYAWVIGIVSLLVLLVGGTLAVVGNRKVKRQLVQGIENIKEVYKKKNGDTDTKWISEAAADKQLPGTTSQVKKIKKKLTSQQP